MAYGSYESSYKRSAKTAKKADIIIENNKEIVRKIDELSARLQENAGKLEDALGRLEKLGAVRSAEHAPEEKVPAAPDEELVSLRRDLKFLAAQNESIYLELSRRIGEISSVPAAQGEGVSRPAEIDYDKLAQKVTELLPAQEYVSPDYIACKVAEQIVVPDGVQTASPESQRAAYSDAPAPVPVDLEVDEENLADRIALKVGSIKAEDFDILVDDDGCASISREITRVMDYDIIAAAVAEKLRSALDIASGSETDYDEMAARISEKITVSGINEDAIADRAAAALSNALPEIDTDEIADKVASQVLGGIPAAEIDSDAICKNISDKLIESQESHDYDIVIDEEGLDKMTEYVSGEVLKNTDARFDKLERQIAELKALLAAGYVAREAAPSEAYIQDDNALVTVSDIVEEEGGEPDELVEELDEQPAEGEIMPDGLGEGAVDFEHMMKYNRSFIARIIQSSDEQKEYYGKVKTALLSYSKVNSSVAWGAERFNKGRETVARLKIRGKTLCLYLALDPSEYKYSVYHHADVSDNKSMHGTPLMVKIKSPLGVKKAIRLIDDMLTKRGAVKRTKSAERDYAAMYPYESMEELIEDGLVKDVSAGN